MHMNRTNITALGVSGVVALGLAACGSSNNGTGSSSSASSGGGGAASSINGAGATFPQPVYQQWASDLKSQGLTVNYQGIGSGGGIAQFTSGTVDFGATDAAMKDEEVKAAEKKGTPVHIPSVFGAVTVSYNVPGAPKNLKLDGGTVANLFFGNIKTWNDPAITKLNPGSKLPSTKVTVCHRSDESGTSKLFTTFLSDYSAEWKSKIGADKTVKWPTGTGASGNSGVAACVKQNTGAVGYVEQAYALQNGFTTAQLKNKSGNYIKPTLAATAAAGVGLTVPADLRFDSINAPGAKAYPIASATFLLVYKDMCKAGLAKPKAQAVVKWLDYVVGPGQQVAPKLDYAPLPASLLAKDKAKIAGLTCDGSPLKAG